MGTFTVNYTHILYLLLKWKFIEWDLKIKYDIFYSTFLQFVHLLQLLTFLFILALQNERQKKIINKTAWWLRTTAWQLLDDSIQNWKQEGRQKKRNYEAAQLTRSQKLVPRNRRKKTTIMCALLQLWLSKKLYYSTYYK